VRSEGSQAPVRRDIPIYRDISSAQTAGRGARGPGTRPNEGRSDGCVSVCLGQAGIAAGRADFGPDYQSPSRASLRPRRLGTPSHATPAEGHHPLPAAGSTSLASDEVTSLVRALALHGVAMLRSHLASPLRPGRGVLIRSVSRRLGSVACVREDASPNEVPNLTNLRMPVSLPGCQTEPPSSRSRRVRLTARSTCLPSPGNKTCV
jgi:hypothetical protein